MKSVFWQCATGRQGPALCYVVNKKCLAVSRVYAGFSGSVEGLLLKSFFYFSELHNKLNIACSAQHMVLLCHNRNQSRTKQLKEQAKTWKKTGKMETCVRDKSEQSYSYCGDVSLLSGVQRRMTQALRAWGYWCSTGHFSYADHRNPISDPSSPETRLFSQRLAPANVCIPRPVPSPAKAAWSGISLSAIMWSDV